MVVRRKKGETKKFSVGVLQLNTEVVHYIVPSKEPAAYLQAKVRTTSASAHVIFWRCCCFSRSRSELGAPITTVLKPPLDGVPGPS